MILYILFGLIAVAYVVFMVRFTRENYRYEGLGLTVLSWFAGLLVTALAGLVVSGVLWAILFNVYKDNPAQVKSKTTVELVALNNTTAVEGSYGGNIFVSYGEVSEGRVLNYIVDRGGNAFNLRQVAVTDQVIIVEHDEFLTTPSLTVVEYEYRNDFLMPGNIISYQSDYTFNVPAGTVSPGYAVDNTK